MSDQPPKIRIYEQEAKQHWAQEAANKKKALKAQVERATKKGDTK